jgi:hypothetical protein
MNAITDHAIFSLRAEGEFFLLKARSDCIDAFAKVELSAHRLSTLLKVTPVERVPFSQLIRTLRVASPGPQLSKMNAPKLREICDRITELLPQRADLVHSEMSIAIGPTGPLAVFRNAAAVSAHSPRASVYDLAEFEQFTRDVRSLAGQLDEMRKPQTKPVDAVKLPCAPAPSQPNE